MPSPPPNETLEEREIRLIKRRDSYRNDTRKEEHHLRSRVKYASDPLLREKARKNANEWYKNNRDVVLAENKKNWLHMKCKKHGITLDEFNAMQLLQRGLCAICGCSEPHDRKTRLNIDHDHSNGMVRGLLCSKCNSALGLFGDRIDL